MSLAGRACDSLPGSASIEPVLVGYSSSFKHLSPSTIFSRLASYARGLHRGHRTGRFPVIQTSPEEGLSSARRLRKQASILKDVHIFLSLLSDGRQHQGSSRAWLRSVRGTSRAIASGTCQVPPLLPIRHYLILSDGVFPTFGSIFHRHQGTEAPLTGGPWTYPGSTCETCKQSGLQLSWNPPGFRISRMGD